MIIHQYRGFGSKLPHTFFYCKKFVLKIQEYIHEGANLKFYIPNFFNVKLLIPEYSPIYRFWFQTAAYFFTVYIVQYEFLCLYCTAFYSSIMA
jgi:hypothetical protein